MSPASLGRISGSQGVSSLALFRQNSILNDDEGPVYAEDVFSTRLYEGNANGQGDTAQTIYNGIDLQKHGGLVWLKNRDQGGTSAWSNYLFDTERGVSKYLRSNDSDPEVTNIYSLTGFTNSGFRLGETGGTNNNTDEYTSWTFRKKRGFFDMQTWQGDGVQGREIAHNLGTEPGMIIVKSYVAGTGATGWMVYHRGVNNTRALRLDSTNGSASYISSAYWDDTHPTSTHFTVGNHEDVNGDFSTYGRSYIAYIFPRDGNTFGENGNESIIKCDSASHTTGTWKYVDLGFEPQFLLIKSGYSSSGWWLLDNMRGIRDSYSDSILYANYNNAEDSGNTFAELTPNGFRYYIPSIGTNQGIVYMAIRRPHRTPTSATTVFQPIESTLGTNTEIVTGILSDWFLYTYTAGVYTSRQTTRLTGGRELAIAQVQETTTQGVFFDSNTSITKGAANAPDIIGYHFRRAPGFFDIVTYDGSSSAFNVYHNLGVKPEMIIIKARVDSVSSPGVNFDWIVHHKDTGINNYTKLNTNDSAYSTTTILNNTEPTDTRFTVGTNTNVNSSSLTYVAYLFASLPGISKVGSYSGNTGNDVIVDCGFSNGCRFLMIKRTDTRINGQTHDTDWYVWDTERSAGFTYYHRLNADGVAAQVTNDSIVSNSPLNNGFRVLSSAPASLNATGGTYIYLAIA